MLRLLALPALLLLAGCTLPMETFPPTMRYTYNVDGIDVSAPWHAATGPGSGFVAYRFENPQGISEFMTVRLESWKDDNAVVVAMVPTQGSPITWDFMGPNFGEVRGFLGWMNSTNVTGTLLVAWANATSAPVVQLQDRLGTDVTLVWNSTDVAMIPLKPSQAVDQLSPGRAPIRIDLGSESNSTMLFLRQSRGDSMSIYAELQTSRGEHGVLCDPGTSAGALVMSTWTGRASLSVNRTGVDVPVVGPFQPHQERFTALRATLPDGLMPESWTEWRRLN